VAAKQELAISAALSFYIDQFCRFQSKNLPQVIVVGGPMLRRARPPAMTYRAATTAESEAARSTAESDAATSATKPGPNPSPTEGYAARAAGLNTSPEAVERRHRAGDLTCFWRRTGLQFVAALAAVIVGCAFGYVVAGNDHRMQIFLSATVAAGLFFVFSAFASQLNRKSRRTQRR
jgi:hypothetical protein